ncbi:Isobutyryl-CoA dehydrogenase, mitochondrial [Smittium culicis]|uniref:Isobutyryl-CoA dehydrogenase, mitochondrial n=2 Tax=Smittium culicis TaxID=133412 RepID=A0A1R1XV13_9FUNG|nr:Isobutyryl-CoA dehydrogenase, mitochondrial [Smittium culicis]
MDIEEYMCRETLNEAAQLGFGKLYVSEESGGVGLSRESASVVFEALSKGCVSTTAMCSWMIDTFGTQSQKDLYLEKLCSMEYLGSYCLTEPNSGSDATSIKTTASLVNNEYVLNGTKAFISNGGDSDMYIVMARTGGSGPKGISTLLVPKSSEGLSFGKKESKVGWNSQPTRMVIFDNCKVPKENLLGGVEGQGFKYAMMGLDGGRINIASCSLGAAQMSIEQTVDYCSTREQFGQPISKFQNTQFEVASMASGLFASRTAVRQAARLLDGSGGYPKSTITAAVAMAKQFATDTCFDICNRSLQLHGGYGYLKDYPVQQFMRDTRVHQILEGTNEIMKVIVSRSIFNAI